MNHILHFEDTLLEAVDLILILETYSDVQWLCLQKRALFIYLLVNFLQCQMMYKVVNPQLKGWRTLMDFNMVLHFSKGTRLLGFSSLCRLFQVQGGK